MPEPRARPPLGQSGPHGRCTRPGLQRDARRADDERVADAAGYWAGPAAPPAPATRPPVRPRPGGPARLLLVLAGLVLVVGAVSTTRVREAGDLGEVLPVGRDATAAEGWIPTWTDASGRPARWDPCTPVPYVVQSASAPSTGRRDLAEALARVSAASGLRFLDEGDTDEVPSQGRAAYQPERYGDRWAPLLVAWVPPAATDLGLGGGVQGLSLAVAVPNDGGPSLVSGQVVLDADHRLASGFGPGTTDGEVLLHELTHAVGLGHVQDPTQVMYPHTTHSESAFGAGDRAGLAAVGAPAGCHPAPRARPLRLAR